MQHLKWIGVGASVVATVAATAGVFSGLWVAGLKTATTATGIFGGVASAVGEMLKYPKGYLNCQYLVGMPEKTIFSLFIIVNK